MKLWIPQRYIGRLRKYFKVYIAEVVALIYACLRIRNRSILPQILSITFIAFWNLISLWICWLPRRLKLHYRPLLCGLGEGHFVTLHISAHMTGPIFVRGLSTLFIVMLHGWKFMPKQKFWLYFIQKNEKTFRNGKLSPMCHYKDTRPYLIDMLHQTKRLFVIRLTQTRDQRYTLTYTVQSQDNHCSVWRR